MDISDDLYLEAQHVKSIAIQHETEADYWRIVHQMLLEEAHLHSAAHIRHEERRIIKTIRKYTNLSRRGNRAYNKLMRQYRRRVE